MKRLLPIILAVALALVAAGIVFFYTRGAEQRAVEDQQPVTVLVSTGFIPQGIALGDAVAGGLAQSTQVPANSAPLGALNGITPENSALLALNNVDPGQILLSTNFVASLPDLSPISVPDGKIAVAFTIGDPERVGNFVRPGSNVVVFDSYDSGATGGTGGGANANGQTTGTLTTRMLIDSAQVLAVGESTSAITKNPDGTTTTAQTPSALLTVALDQAQAEKLILANQTGKLYLGLLGNGAEVTKSAGTTDGNLFD
jgi:pilus assembly protein CpaB